MTERQKAILRGAIDAAYSEGLFGQSDDNVDATEEELREILDLLDVPRDSWMRRGG